MSEGKKLDVDGLIAHLLAGKSQGRPILEWQLRELIRLSREIFMSQPSLLNLDVPVTIMGDVHGQFSDLLRHFTAVGFPPKRNFLLLGDYVDRGKRSLETLSLLLAYKVKFPANFFLLRGNHECASINRIYGFYDECKRRYNIKLWKSFTDLFNCMPVAAVVDNTIFATHGGLSPDLKDLAQVHLDKADFSIPLFEIASIARPCDVPEFGLMCDLLWSDPDPDIGGWGENDRGVSYTFGPDVVRQFLDRHHFSLIVRAHQVIEDGYQFFAQRQLVTIFSAPNYCGEFDNAAAVMHVDADLTCSFDILKDIKYDVGRIRSDISDLKSAVVDMKRFMDRYMRDFDDIPDELEKITRLIERDQSESILISIRNLLQRPLNVTFVRSKRG